MTGVCSDSDDEIWNGDCSWQVEGGGWKAFPYTADPAHRLRLLPGPGTQHNHALVFNLTFKEVFLQYFSCSQLFEVILDLDHHRNRQTACIIISEYLEYYPARVQAEGRACCARKGC